MLDAVNNITEDDNKNIYENIKEGIEDTNEEQFEDFKEGSKILVD